MNLGTVKTSITLEPEVKERAQEKVKGTGQSLSSYINVLLRQDMNLARPGKKAKRANRITQAAA